MSREYKLSMHFYAHHIHAIRSYLEAEEQLEAKNPDLMSVLRTSTRMWLSLLASDMERVAEIQRRNSVVDFRRRNDGPQDAP